VIWAAQASIVSVLITVLFDSWFWRRWVWPEYQVWYFNVVLNKSHLWGTQPFHYYFSYYLPRAFVFNLPAVVYGLCKIPTPHRVYGICMVAFIFVYSFLPHKEMRFIIYAFPIFAAYGGWGWTHVFQKARKSRIAQLMCVILSVMCFTTFLTCLISLFLSFHNYPGGEALYRLHQILSKESPGKQYIIYILSTRI
jgi:alpha-1,6-mannosyltransferase